MASLGRARQPQTVPVVYPDVQAHLQILAKAINDLVAVASFRGAMVRKSASQTTANYTNSTAISFDTEVYDFGEWHSSTDEFTRLTVPGGVSIVQVGGNIQVTLTTADTFKELLIYKNGSNLFHGSCRFTTDIGTSQAEMSICSGPLRVSPGDYFELFFQEESDTSITVNSAQTNFWIRALG